MRTRFRTMLHMLTSLLSTLWGLRNNDLWRRAAKWSAGLWLFNTVLFFFALKHFGNPYLAVGIRTVATEVQSYAVNKLRIFPNRQVSLGTSGTWTAPMAVFCFVYHKATGILLVAVFGLGFIPATAVLTVIGIAENPLRFLFNNKFPFAEKTATT
jgi:hypothetical protein